ncbi:MAG: BMC domain-containing protein [Verrucomicrobia bacterium]|nr:BMC domain-containing protein [Verrucomicrobiota bacterium]MCH8510151.1 BMC domain-containing protein [Kiritimatiellia bacterium]
MAQKAIGLIETKGLACLVHATDAMLKAADVKLVGPMKNVGSGLCSAIVEGDVAAVKASIEVGSQAASEYGEVVSVQVIPRPHDEVAAILPKPAAAKK